MTRSSHELRLTVNGQDLTLPAEVSAEIFSLVEAGRTIDAIKRLREASGLGLKEAKDVVDALARMKGG